MNTTNIILGCAGSELWRENAEATADMINAVPVRGGEGSILNRE